jgi:NADPH-dependent ferric siderophore reductase
MSTQEAPARRRRTWLGEVVRTARVTPRMIRVVLGGGALTGFTAGEFTDRYVKLLFPPAGADYSSPFDADRVRAERPAAQWPVTRTYTIPAWDPARAELTLDFVYHGDRGVAGPWAAAARPGDLICFLGPGGGYAPDPGADWHLLVDQTWVHRAGSSAAAGGGLADRVRALGWRDGVVHAFVHGEAGLVKEVRSHLRFDRAVPGDRLSASGYWRRGMTDEGWRASKKQWNGEVEQDEQAHAGAAEPRESSARHPPG